MMTIESFERSCSETIRDYLKRASEMSKLSFESPLIKAQFYHDLTANMMVELRRSVEDGVNQYHLDQDVLMDIVRKHFNIYSLEIAKKLSQ